MADGQWDGPFYRVRTAAFEVDFRSGADDKLDALCNVDAFVVLADGSRQSATIVTVDEVRRLMDHWATTGDETGGTYFSCPDGLIVRRAGVDHMVDALAHLHVSGQLPAVLRAVDGS